MTEKHKPGMSGDFSLRDSIDTASQTGVDFELPHAAQAAKRLFETGQEQKAAIEELQQDNMTDSKTGLLNSAGLEHEYNKLKESLSHIRRHSDLEHATQAHSILFIDLDDFKQLNSTLGHADADKLLAVTGAFIKGNLKRETDKAGRFGGDEFVVLLPDTSKEDAAIVAERMRQTMNGITSIENKPIAPSMSIGVGTLDPWLEFSETVHGANEAMYAAKGAGKNQVVVFDTV
jgi:diguanylate cyclase (GGDEF)-like protein